MISEPEGGKALTRWALRRARKPEDFLGELRRSVDAAMTRHEVRPIRLVKILAGRVLYSAGDMSPPRFGPPAPSPVGSPAALRFMVAFETPDLKMTAHLRQAE